MFEHHRQLLDQIGTCALRGRVSATSGLTIRAEGFPAAVGTMCKIHSRNGGDVDAQVVGFNQSQAVVMPLREVQGIAAGDEVYSDAALGFLPVGPALLGRVIDGRGQPLDGAGCVHPECFYPVHADAPAALSRERITQSLGVGIRAIDGLLSVGTGQRLGIFAGTGVGKSILLGMITRYTAADVAVVALVGERGREVRDFIYKDVGPEGMQRTVMVVSTSDESPVMRVRACFVATAIAEYFRDQGKNVLLLLDSLTRVAMAQRQIGLAAGEPPATKGYTPSVFALLPKLLERAGKTSKGSITGFYSVLVEGDDINEPISDAVRGVLDGHVWLSRSLAGKGHYPAVDVLNSISRLMVDVVDEPINLAARLIRRVLGTWVDIEDLVNIGAYARGTNWEFDLAIEAKPKIDAFLQQAIEQHVTLDQSHKQLRELADWIKDKEKKLKG